MIKLIRKIADFLALDPKGKIKSSMLASAALLSILFGQFAERMFDTWNWQTAPDNTSIPEIILVIGWGMFIAIILATLISQIAKSAREEKEYENNLRNRHKD